MRISNNGLQFIKNNEGLRLRAYIDTAGVWTIGYGHTGNVRKGDTITDETATAYLIQDLRRAEDTVNELVKVPLTQSQYDALVDFVFNLGKQRFLTSTLLKLVNKKQYLSASAEFSKWNKEHRDGKLVANKGLTKRRSAEQTLFLS